MRELRYRPAEGLVDGHLLGCVRDMIVTADDVRDAHQRVVDGNDVVVDRNSLRCAADGGADEDGVADCLRCKLDFAADEVVESQGMVFDFETHGVGLVGGKIVFDCFLRKIAALAGINLRAVFGCGLFALSFQLFRGAEAAVGFALVQQLLGVSGVDIEALRLAIGAVCAFGGVVETAGAFIPVEAEPVQVFNELGFVTGFAAFQIGILNAQQKLTACAACKKPVVESCPCIAYMHHPGG